MRSNLHLWAVSLDNSFFFVSHFILLWSESLQITELSDLFVIDFNNESSECKFMILIKNNEKINLFKNVEHCVLMQNKKSLLCDISALAHYFFWRWHYTDKLFSKFRVCKDWYQICITIEKWVNIIKSLNYNTQLNWMKQMYDEAHVSVIKSMYDNQFSDTHHAEWADVNDLQIHSLSLLLFKMSHFTSMQFEMSILNVCQSFSIICFRFISDLKF